MASQRPTPSSPSSLVDPIFYVRALFLLLTAAMLVPWTHRGVAISTVTISASLTHQGMELLEDSMDGFCCSVLLLSASNSSNS